AGVDADDPATRDSRGHVPADYTEFLLPDGLQDARIGVPRENYTGYSEETDRILEDAIRAMEDAGATIVDPADIPTAGDMGGPSFQVLLYEFKADLNAYLDSLP
ncbi:MAG: amidase, partial [Gemmatimonadetes bacterium]|nr:amidase [Gemmatimonadota bacterium]NIQ60282.1 amidase [Gemmatimonadota bacterium]NIU80497.1 amidase [Gammaproteobacteria bacterium]NIX25333.1 amidase [Actinomycetota bacterium]NIX48824.1 amidase [Gemmatimonadota bacterium]